MSEIRIPVNPEDFLAAMKKFMEEAKKYAEFAKKIKDAQDQLFQSMASIGQTIRAQQQSAMNSILGFMRRLPPLMNRFKSVLMRSIDRMLQTIGPSARTFLRSMTFARDIFPNLESLSGLFGLARGFVGGPWGFLIYVGFKAVKWIYEKSFQLMQVAQKDRIQALISGTTVGGIRALRALGWFLPPDPRLWNIISTIRAAQQSTDAIVIQHLLGVRQGQDSVETMLQTLIQVQQFLRRFPGKETQAMEAFQLPVSQETMLSLSEMNPSQLRQLAMEIVRLQHEFEMNTNDSVNITNFLFARRSLIDTIYVRFQEILVHSGMADALIKIADFMNQLLSGTSGDEKKSGPHKETALERLMRSVEQESNSLFKRLHQKFDAINKDLKSFTDSLKKAETYLGSFSFITPAMAEAAPGIPGGRNFAETRARYLGAVGEGALPVSGAPARGRPLIGARTAVGGAAPSGAPGTYYRGAPGAAPHGIPGGAPIRVPGGGVGVPGGAPRIPGGGGGGRRGISQGPAPAPTPLPTPSGTMSSNLATDRARFAQELKDNPELRERVFRMAANEQGTLEGQQAVIESMMNRASIRHTTLAAQARSTLEGGYYENAPTSGSVSNPQSRAALNQALSNALAGSNTANYATENASGGLAGRRAAAQGRQAYVNGESFFYPPADQRANRQSWQEWQRRMSQGDTVASPTAPAPTASSPSSIPPAPSNVPSGQQAGPPAIGQGAVTAVGGGPPAAFIVHHTGGRGTIAGLQATLAQRGLGVEYAMDRDGKIYQIGGPGSSNIKPAGVYAGDRMVSEFPEGDPRRGLSNENVVGMEVIANNDGDVTPAQVLAAKNFFKQYYPNTPVFGHGEVNPGHKEQDEGMTIVNAVRNERAGAVPGSVATPEAAPTGSQSASVSGPARFSVVPGKGEGADPRLYEIAKEASKSLPPGWSAKVESGFEARSHGTQWHPTRRAVDIGLYDEKGNKIDWYQNPQTFPIYQSFAQKMREVQTQKYPELNDNFRWGGYFSGPIGAGGKYGAMDLMHFDTGPSQMMGAGSWEGGVTPEAARQWGLAKSGLPQPLGPPTEVADTRGKGLMDNVTAAKLKKNEPQLPSSYMSPVSFAKLKIDNRSSKDVVQNKTNGAIVASGDAHVVKTEKITKDMVKEDDKPKEADVKGKGDKEDASNESAGLSMDKP